MELQAKQLLTLQGQYSPVNFINSIHHDGKGLTFTKSMVWWSNAIGVSTMVQWGDVCVCVWGAVPRGADVQRHPFILLKPPPFTLTRFWCHATIIAPVWMGLWQRNCSRSFEGADTTTQPCQSDTLPAESKNVCSSNNRCYFLPSILNSSEVKTSARHCCSRQSLGPTSGSLEKAFTIESYYDKHICFCISKRTMRLCVHKPLYVLPVFSRPSSHFIHKMTQKATITQHLAQIVIVSAEQWGSQST